MHRSIEHAEPSLVGDPRGPWVWAGRKLWRRATRTVLSRCGVLKPMMAESLENEHVGGAWWARSERATLNLRAGSSSPVLGTETKQIGLKKRKNTKM